MKILINLNKKTTSGITLLALVITIIVLLIIAGISISTLTGDNSIIKKSIESKTQTEIAEEKELLNKSVIKCIGKNKNNNLIKDELTEQLDSDLGENYTKVTDSTNNTLNVKFMKSGREYKVDSDGNVYEIEPRKL